MELIRIAFNSYSVAICNCCKLASGEYAVASYCSNLTVDATIISPEDIRRTGDLCCSLYYSCIF